MITYKIKEHNIGIMSYGYQILIRNCCLFGGWDKLNNVDYKTPKDALIALAGITDGCPCKVKICKD